MPIADRSVFVEIPVRFSGDKEVVRVAHAQVQQCGIRSLKPGAVGGILADRVGGPVVRDVGTGELAACNKNAHAGWIGRSGAAGSLRFADIRFLRNRKQAKCKYCDIDYKSNFFYQ